jgi:hypothetical protein
VHAEGKIKIEYLGGYERFEPAGEPAGPGAGASVSYRRTLRTVIAE